MTNKRFPIERKSIKLDIFGEKIIAPLTVAGDIPTLFKTFREAGSTPSKEIQRINKFNERFEEIKQFQEQQEGYLRSGQVRRIQ